MTELIALLTMEGIAFFSSDLNTEFIARFTIGCNGEYGPLPGPFSVLFARTNSLARDAGGSVCRTGPIGSTSYVSALYDCSDEGVITGVICLGVVASIVESSAAEDGRLSDVTEGIGIGGGGGREEWGACLAQLGVLDDMGELGAVSESLMSIWFRMAGMKCGSPMYSPSSVNKTIFSSRRTVDSGRFFCLFLKDSRRCDTKIAANEGQIKLDQRM